MVDSNVSLLLKLFDLHLIYWVKQTCYSSLNILDQKTCKSLTKTLGLDLRQVIVFEMTLWRVLRPPLQGGQVVVVPSYQLRFSASKSINPCLKSSYQYWGKDMASFKMRNNTYIKRQKWFTVEYQWISFKSCVIFGKLHNLFKPQIPHR